MLRPGDHAPDFTAVLSTGGTFTLSAVRSAANVVLSFYPKDFSSGCTRQVCSYRDGYAEIVRLGAILVGVSPDRMESHEAFAARHRLPFALVSDERGSIARLYRATWLGGIVPVPMRVTYVIDRGGIIRLAAHHEVLIGRHLERVLECLRGISSEGDGG